MRPQQESSGRASVLAQAPRRADLAGGTIDLWPLYLFHPGAVTVNFALNILTTCRVTPHAGREIQLRSLDTRREEKFSSFEELCAARSFKHPIGAYCVRFFRPEGGFTLETNSEAPAGAGISGSSALMIATTAALARFTGRKMEKESIRSLAQNIEAQIINVPTGCQDYYPALYGGVSAIQLDTDGIHRWPLAVPPEEMDSRFVLVYTGAPRQSGINNWEVFKRHIDGDKKVIRNFESISQIAQKMRVALAKGQWDETARLLREEWKLRKSNFEGISTPLIEQLMSGAKKHGAVAAKVCGAGGGGCVIIMVREGAKNRVAQSLRENGGQVLPFMVAREGLKVTVVKARGAAE